MKDDEGKYNPFGMFIFLKYVKYSSVGIQIDSHSNCDILLDFLH